MSLTRQVRLLPVTVCFEQVTWAGVTVCCVITECALLHCTCYADMLRIEQESAMH